jgi:mono/diheme cytochrome c family protein
MRSVIPLFFCVTVCSAFATTPAYTKAQAVQGASLYKTNCAMCHGSALNNGGAPKLAGPEFLQKWGPNTIDDFHYIMSTTMPQTKPGGLKPDQYLSLIAYVLQKNGYKAGTTALKATNLKQYTFKN